MSKNKTTFPEAVAYDCGYRSGLEKALLICRQRQFAAAPYSEIKQAIEKELRMAGG